MKNRYGQKLRKLLAALEFKSQVSLSFGNNFNGRSEEAIGTEHDLWTAYRKDVRGRRATPIPGLDHASRGLRQVQQCPVRDNESDFRVYPDFKEALCTQHYDRR